MLRLCYCATEGLRLTDDELVIRDVCGLEDLGSDTNVLMHIVRLI